MVWDMLLFKSKLRNIRFCYLNLVVHFEMNPGFFGPNCGAPNPILALSEVIRQQNVCFASVLFLVLFLLSFLHFPVLQIARAGEFDKGPLGPGQEFLHPPPFFPPPPEAAFLAHPPELDRLAMEVRCFCIAVFVVCDLLSLICSLCFFSLLA